MVGESRRFSFVALVCSRQTTAYTACGRTERNATGRIGTERYLGRGEHYPYERLRGFLEGGLGPCSLSFLLVLLLPFSSISEVVADDVHSAHLNRATGRARSLTWGGAENDNTYRGCTTWRAALGARHFLFPSRLHSFNCSSNFVLLNSISHMCIRSQLQSVNCLALGI